MIIDSTLMFDLFLVTLACFGSGAVGALITARSPTLARVVGHGGALLGALAALTFGLAGLAGGSMQLNVADFLPIGGAAFGVDRLSAFFVMVVAAGAIPGALYAIGFTREYAGKHSLAGMGFALNILYLFTALVGIRE
jgi:formate hydrogenlyase subunit 3/multisubunit Na+/H+ antiporter MnhD subunit